MSDIKKWMNLMESVAPVLATRPSGKGFTRDATVILGANVGGGVGRFVEFTTEGAALIDVKGVMREFAEGDFAVPERDTENGNDWFHMSVTGDTPGSLNDRPELRPGDMIKIADVYGTVIGPGFGVFIGYGTTGQDCVVLFDGKQIVVPIENVASVLEQDAKDNFDDMDNDGNLSPMSYGSDNVKIEQPQTGMSNQEPAMDHRDEFTKWMEAVEEALTTETSELEENVPMGNGCSCGAWDCPTCFPEQHEMPGMNGTLDGMGGADLTAIVPMPADGAQGMEMGGPDVCPHCGHSHEEAELDQGGPCGVDQEIDFNMGLEEMPVDEEPMDFDQTPAPKAPSERSSDGRGIKLGTIVQKTEYRQAGEESPLTHGGDNLDEELPDGANPDDYGKAGRYAQDQFGNLGEQPGELDMGSESDYMDRMSGDAMMSDADIEGAQDMMSAIKYMQDLGLSKSPNVYSEDDMANMSLDQLRKVHSEVTGEVAETGMQPSLQQGNMTMENVDSDIQTWLGRFKAYDELRASKAPVMEKKKPDADGDGVPDWADKKAGKDDKKEVKEEGNPWEKLAKKSDDTEAKTTKTSKGGTVTKTDKGLEHKGTYGEPKKADVKEGADQEVLAWMSRFAKLGNMKGYGR